jgi:hypothetical protein
MVVHDVANSYGRSEALRLNFQELFDCYVSRAGAPALYDGYPQDHAAEESILGTAALEKNGGSLN